MKIGFCIKIIRLYLTKNKIEKYLGKDSMDSPDLTLYLENILLAVSNR